MHPLRTLQIPLGSIGKAPEQILKLQAISKKFFQQKKTYWALRTLLWELHLIQDLHQPFHVTQVPYYRMLPWKDAFRKFVPRSTQVIANFHYAYEGLVKESLQDGMLSRLNACFEVPARISFPAISRPVLDEVIRLTRAQAEKVGVPLVHLWNREMKDPVMNLPEGLGSIDYYSYLNANPDEDGQKEIIQNVDRILQSTCELMKKLSLITFSELDRAFQFQ